MELDIWRPIWPNARTDKVACLSLEFKAKVSPCEPEIHHCAGRRSINNYQPDCRTCVSLESHNEAVHSIEMHRSQCHSSGFRLVTGSARNFRCVGRLFII